MERTEWRPFRSLLNKKDGKMFDEMFSYANYIIRPDPICEQIDKLFDLMHAYK
jgi:hypothetical protein